METFKGYHYKVTDTEIKPTGKIEVWLCKDRQQAIEYALYTHNLHNRNAFATKNGVIHCSSCGQIAVVSPAVFPASDGSC